MKSIIVSMLLSIAAAAQAQTSECSNIQYLDNKSQGVTMTHGACESPDEVALGTVFTLQQGGRLWLKSKANPVSDTDFQIVCQSLSSTPLEVTVSSLFLPWIKPNELQNCSGWVDNRLKCDAADGTRNVFFCAIAAIKQVEPTADQQLAMTTSVKMRTISAYEEQRNIDKVAEAMTPEIKLCRTLFHIENDVTVGWSVDAEGHAQDITLTPSQAGDERFSNCIESVVKSFDFSQANTGHRFTRTF
ncbi:MAG: hypothetical protein Kow0065_18640 [Methylomicrobium sp.]